MGLSTHGAFARKNLCRSSGAWAAGTASNSPGWHPGEMRLAGSDELRRSDRGGYRGDEKLRRAMIGFATCALTW